MKPEMELNSRYGMRLEEFSALMEHRIRDILIVAAPYSAFIMEEDGQLAELIFQEYRNLDLNMRYVPKFFRASTGREALDILATQRVDMVVATARLQDMDVADFAAAVKEKQDIPVGVLAAHAWDLPELDALRDCGAVDWLFLWQGDVKVLLAMIKQVEDRMNADHDVIEGGVQVIILVEDEVRFYSVFLPQIYTEVTSQTSRLMAEGFNLPHRLLRIRARPKILLAHNYEEAVELIDRYAESLLGVISDVSFPKDGEEYLTSGMDLARHVREKLPDVPVLLQSTESSHADLAAQVGAEFISKTSPNLLDELRRFMLAHFGFGDFVFRTPDGTIVGRANDLKGLGQQLLVVPDESVEFHARRNHFSAWLKARSEFELAAMLRPVTVAEFSSVDELRGHLAGTITAYLREVQRHIILDFDADTYDKYVIFAKIGSGSMGGKGRGLAFVNKLLAQKKVDLLNVHVTIPQTVVLASDIFEEFLDRNDLQDFMSQAAMMSDQEILDAFRRGRFSRPVRRDLAGLLRQSTEPLAVRSSSILEDSLYQPFAGVYATVMLPNCHPSLDVRLAQLIEAIKVVYASTYFREARNYLSTTPHRIEEERMAVLIQKLVGTQHGTLIYPTLSGVASSFNYYPFGNVHPDDGVALLAVGLGKSVVDGFEALRFCPRHPQVLPQFSSVKDKLDNAQRMFYALDMERSDLIPGMDVDASLLRTSTVEASRAVWANHIFSTYEPENDRIVSGLGRGTPLVTFSSLLRQTMMPLPDLLDGLLGVFQEGIGTPVEIEFAMDLDPSAVGDHQFHVLQVRPMVSARTSQDIDIVSEQVDRAIVFSEQTLGHGRSGPIQDIVYVDPDHLNRVDTQRVVRAIDAINQQLLDEHRPCLLIGPGRWGSRDPWLGIPVVWSQISTARVIVETDFADLKVEPSQGSHFFHNLTCFGVAYFHVHQIGKAGRVDQKWFEAHDPIRTELDGVVRHIRLDKPIEALVDGAKGVGVVLEVIQS